VDEYLLGNTLLPVTGGLQRRSLKTLALETQKVSSAVPAIAAV